MFRSSSNSEKKKTLSSRSSYQSPVSAMKEQLPANNTNRAARMQDVETSKKREQSRKAYAQRQASPAEPSKTLGAVAKKWEQQTKKVISQTTPPKLSNKIATIEQKRKSPIAQSKSTQQQIIKGLNHETPSLPALQSRALSTVKASKKTESQASSLKSNSDFRTRGISPLKETDIKKNIADYRTRSAAKNAIKPLDSEIGSSLTMENIGGFLKDNTLSGLSRFNGGLAKTADFFLPDFMTPQIIQKGIDYYKNSEKELTQRAAKNNAQRFGRAGAAAGELYQDIVEAAPQAILALLSGGQSVAEPVLNTLSQTGDSAGVLQTIGKAMKKPAFWSSFTQTVGNDYENAKDHGAKEFQAQASAIAGSLLNAGIEIGSGIEKCLKMRITD